MHIGITNWKFIGRADGKQILQVRAAPVPCLTREDAHV